MMIVFFFPHLPYVYELHHSCPRRHAAFLDCMVLPPRVRGVHWFTGLVPNIDEDFREAESGAILVDGKMIGETNMAKVVW